MRGTQSIEHAIHRSLHDCIRRYLAIFGGEPRFDLSVFCIEKGNVTGCQKLVSSLYNPEDFTCDVFREKLKRELFRPEHGLLDEIRTYENFFPDFYHDFLKRECESAAGNDLLFFDLPRYDHEHFTYLPVFAVDRAWHETRIAPAGTVIPDRERFFASVMQTLRTFLETETRATKNGLRFDHYQVQRLHALAAAGLLASVSGNESFFQYINTIASLKYEKQECAAQIALCRHRDIPFTVRFTVPVPVNEHRKVRKLLAATGKTHCLICGGDAIEGVADIAALEASRSETPYFINITRHMTWELVHNGSLLLRSCEGVLSTSRHEMSAGDISRLVMARLALAPDKAHAIRTLIQAARGAGHGSILVFTDGAAAEAHRLRNDGFLAEPFILKAADLPFFTVMDGALLLDTDCRCHALGVILDGEAGTASDSSRGARFNSALRYYEKKRGENILIVVVSDDGMINLIPRDSEAGA